MCGAKKESHPQIAGDSPIGTMSNAFWAGMRIDSLYPLFSFLNFTPTKYQKCNSLFWSRITTCVFHKGMVPHMFLIGLLDDAQGDIYLAIGHPITFDNIKSKHGRIRSKEPNYNRRNNHVPFNSNAADLTVCEERY